MTDHETLSFLVEFEEYMRLYRRYHFRKDLLWAWVAVYPMPIFALFLGYAGLFLVIVATLGHAAIFMWLYGKLGAARTACEEFAESLEGAVD